MIIELEVPTKIKKGVKKVRTWGVDLNTYRNLNHFTNDSLKKIFKETIADKIAPIKAKHINSITYIPIYKDNRRHDKMNVASVVDKYFMDALTESGCIEDDNDKIVGEVHVPYSLVDGRSACKVIIDYD